MTAQQATMKRTFKQIFRKRKFPLVVLALALLLILLFTARYRLPSVGFALQEPPGSPVDLTERGSVEVDISRVPEFEIGLATSSGERKVYVLSTTNIGGTAKAIRYTLSDGDLLLSSGYLGTSVTDTRGLFLDDDFLPDMEIIYNPDIQVLSVVNLLFVEPATADIRLFHERVLVEKFALAKVGEPFTFTVEASSDKATPEVRVFFLDKEINSSKQVQDLGITGLSRSVSVRFTPREAKPSWAVVEAVVGGKVSQKQYLFAGDGVVFQRQDDLHYPGITLLLLDETTRQARVDFSFPITASKQPFSLPCATSIALEGETSALTAEQGATLATVFAYDIVSSRPLQWRENIPSEFATLEPFRGYLLQTKQSQPLRLHFSCLLSEELPSLRKGWNLVGMTGFLTRPLADLDAKLPPGARVRQVKELQRDDVSAAAWPFLEPGKAYWVLVE